MQVLIDKYIPSSLKDLFNFTKSMENNSKYILIIILFLVIILMILAYLLHNPFLLAIIIIGFSLYNFSRKFNKAVSTKQTKKTE